MTDLARRNSLEELLPGEDPVLADEHPVWLGKGSDRIGSLATTAWFQSAMSAEKTSTVLVLPLLSVMPEAYGTGLGTASPYLPDRPWARLVAAR